MSTRYYLAALLDGSVLIYTALPSFTSMAEVLEYQRGRDNRTSCDVVVAENAREENGNPLGHFSTLHSTLDGEAVCL